MKMKRLLAGILVVVMCFALVACGGTGDEERGPQAKPLLYQVTDGNGNRIWLFGSIHVGRSDYYPLPAYVEDAFKRSDGLAVELDIIAFEKDMGQQTKALIQLVYKDGSTIKDHISSELYKQAVDILKRYNSYMPTLDVYCPAFWGSMIESLMIGEFKADPNLGIDRHMIEMAYELDKEIIEIESAEAQYKMMAEFDDEIQGMILQSSVEGYRNKKEAAAELKEMMDLWASGDEGAFNAYLNAPDDTMTEAEKQANERYMQAMITDRNLAMTQYAVGALAEGKEIFICVGAAHIVGDGAMAELLSQRGYSVELVTE